MRPQLESTEMVTVVREPGISSLDQWIWSEDKRRTEAAHEALSVNGSFPLPVINVVNQSKPHPSAPVFKMSHISPGQGVRVSFAMTTPSGALILHKPSSSW